MLSEKFKCSSPTLGPNSWGMKNEPIAACGHAILDIFIFNTLNGDLIDKNVENASKKLVNNMKIHGKTYFEMHNLLQKLFLI